ncbi:MAG TPA: hypothetical protein VFL96_13170 [Acidobacteriaceae bacterium]|nr:hypothetical protein [Acidobacteriaceae bacterium]
MKNKPAGKADPGAYAGLRNLAFSSSRAEWGLPTPASSADIWAVVMDTTCTDGRSYTVVAIEDGNASIYLSSGGGFIGGVSHEAVSAAAKILVRTAGQYLAQMRKVHSFPLPAPGDTTFYVRTDSGIYSVTAPEEDLGEGRNRFSPLFYAAQDVITEYRLINP